MKSNPSRFTQAALVLVCAVLLVACGSSAPKLSSITISPTTASIAHGTTQQFSATALYSDGSKPDVTSTAGWSSSNSAVATVNTSGLATAVGVGTATISVTL